MNYIHLRNALWDCMQVEMRLPSSKAVAAVTYGKLACIADLHPEDIAARGMANQARFHVFDYAPRHNLFKW